MAKRDNGKLVKWIGVILVIALWSFGVIFTSGGKTNDIKHNTKSLASLTPKVETNTIDIAVIKENIKSIDKKQESILTIQQEILTEVKKSP